MLRVRAYNVLFGDCYLISWKEGNDYHRAWVDFGNFHSDRDAVFDLAVGNDNHSQQHIGCRQVLLSRPVDPHDR